MKLSKIRSAITALALSQPFVCNAALITVNPSDVGWYESNGSTVTNNNYFVGLLDNQAHRNFFVFDLSMISGVIETATIRVFMNDKLNLGYYSFDPTETFSLYEVNSSINEIVNHTASVGVFNDLGDGALFGSQVVSASDGGNFIEVVLNSDGITSLNSSNGLFAVGGLVSTQSGSYDQTLFGGSGGSDPGVEILIAGDLTVTGELPGPLSELNSPTPVPVPAGILLFSSGLMGLMGLIGLFRNKKT